MKRLIFAMGWLAAGVANVTIGFWVASFTIWAPEYIIGQAEGHDVGVLWLVLGLLAAVTGVIIIGIGTGLFLRGFRQIASAIGLS